MFELRWVEPNVPAVAGVFDQDKAAIDVVLRYRCRILQFRCATNPPSEWELSGVVWSEWKDVPTVPVDDNHVDDGLGIRY